MMPQTQNDDLIFASQVVSFLGNIPFFLTTVIKGPLTSERVTDFLHLDWVHPGSYCQNFALDMIFIDHHAWIVFFAFESSHGFHSFC